MVNRPDLVTVFMEVTWNLYQKRPGKVGCFLCFFLGGEGGRDYLNLTQLVAFFGLNF